MIAECNSPMDERMDMDEIFWYVPGMRVFNGMEISYKGIEVKVINEEYAEQIFSMMEIGDLHSSDYPWGLYIIPYDDGSCTAIDNQHEAFTEDFNSLEEALSWLDGDFEVFDEAM